MVLYSCYVCIINNIIQVLRLIQPMIMKGKQRLIKENPQTGHFVVTVLPLLNHAILIIKFIIDYKN